MPPEPSVDSPETATIYRPLVAWRVGANALILPLLVILFFYLAVQLFSIYKRTGTITLGNLIVPVVLVGLSSIVLWRARRTPDAIFLKVSPSGIEYHSAQLVIQTTWDNVESLIVDPLAPAIGLARPAATHMSPLLGRDLSSGRRIPLSAFAYSAHSALAQDLRRYAPHLYTKRV